MTLNVKKVEEFLEVHAQIVAINTNFPTLNDRNTSDYDILLKNEVKDDELDKQLQVQNEYIVNILSARR